jgi:hypothetical protein
MNKKSYTLIMALLCMAFTTIAQDYKKVTFTGAARSLFYADKLDSQNPEKDSITIPKLNSGHVLVDLGINIKPNKNTEVLGMVRIRNDYGGFWGSGVTFDIRQLYVKGVIGGIVRYQLGDINYKMSKYTMWNYDQELISNMPTIFQQQTDVINYDHFYANDNSRRQQGLAAESALLFRKYVKELQLHAVTTRVKTSDFGSVSDRLFTGLNAQLIQSKYLELGLNFTSLYDVKGTARTDYAFHNPVVTATAQAQLDMKGINFTLNTEMGKSRTRYENLTEAPDWSDRFMNTAIAAKHEKSGIKIIANTLFVGADFRSPGAQTKRIDFNGTPLAFTRFTNDQVLRTPIMMDYMRESSFYTLQLRPYLMDFNPSYDNITPYGDATPNRQGLILSLNYDKKDVPVTASVSHSQLQEVRGEGTLLPRKFSRNTVNVDARINKFFGNWKKQCRATLSLRSDKTTRAGEELVRGVDLKTDVLGLGLETEVLNNFDIMLGLQVIKYAGFDYVALRNTYSEVYNFKEYLVGNRDVMSAIGARYRFSEKTFISAQYTKSKQNPLLSTDFPYSVNQFMLLFQMKF